MTRIALWFIAGVMGWLSVMAWDDKWSQQEGVQAIISVLFLFACWGIWMANGSKNELNFDEDLDDDED